MTDRLTRRAALGLLAAAASSGPVHGVALLEEAVTRARAFDRMHALLVNIDGAAVVRERFVGAPLDQPVNIKSISKTVLAALTGAAIDQGLLADVDQSVAPLLRHAFPPDPDPRLERLTVDHLLTMRAGLERTSGANYGAWVMSRDWVADALARPFVAEPGGRMLYSTGSYHLLSAVLTRAAGRSTLALARDLLGEPLGIDIPAWTRDPQGIYLGGNDMALAPEALVRFGEMHRRGGVLDGRRVLSAAWIEAAWTARTVSPWSGDAYGYGWFVREIAGHRTFYGRGYGGQMLYVVPSVRLTAVVISDPTRPAHSAGYVGDLHRLLGETLIPAATA
ncbi:MAG: serine hydrolase domain-containing protein [Pseudomonadota bacterium]